MTAEIHTLTGAYALDALSEVERAAFERHLAECPSCAQEVRELRETAARLGAAAAILAPEQLRDQVMAEIRTTRQVPPSPAVFSQTNRRWLTRLAVLSTAAAVLIAVVFGVQSFQTHQQLDVAQQRLAAISAVITAPDAVTVKDHGAKGSAAAVVSRSQGKVVVLADGIPALDSAHAYQVWLIGPQGPQSAGLLQPGSADRMQPIITAVPATANRIGITVEPAAGSPQPTTTPVLMMTLQ